MRDSENHLKDWPNRLGRSDLRPSKSTILSRLSSQERPVVTRVAFLLALVLFGSASGQGPAFLLYGGGTSHKTFFGCLNCNKFDSGSVCNKFGEFGSRFSPSSIWN